MIKWLLAVIAGFFAYWIGMLLSLGVIGLAAQKIRGDASDAQLAAVGHSPMLVGTALLIGNFACCLTAIAIVPRAQWRTMALVSFAATAAWAIYGQVYAGNAAGMVLTEAGLAIAGSLLGCALAYRLFGRSVSPA